MALQASDIIPVSAFRLREIIEAPRREEKTIYLTIGGKTKACDVGEDEDVEAWTGYEPIRELNRLEEAGFLERPPSKDLTAAYTVHLCKLLKEGQAIEALAAQVGPKKGSPRSKSPRLSPASGGDRRSPRTKSKGLTPFVNLTVKEVKQALKIAKKDDPDASIIIEHSEDNRNDTYVTPEGKVIVGSTGKEVKFISSAVKRITGTGVLITKEAIGNQGEENFVFGKGFLLEEGPSRFPLKSPKKSFPRSKTPPRKRASLKKSSPRSKTPPRKRASSKKSSPKLKTSPRKKY
jgi:hypothetical protein